MIKKEISHVRAKYVEVLVVVGVVLVVEVLVVVGVVDVLQCNEIGVQWCKCQDLR